MKAFLILGLLMARVSTLACFVWTIVSYANFLFKNISYDWKSLVSFCISIGILFVLMVIRETIKQLNESKQPIKHERLRSWAKKMAEKQQVE